MLERHNANLEKTKNNLNSDKEDAIEVLNQSLVRKCQQSMKDQKKQLEAESAVDLSKKEASLKKKHTAEIKKTAKDLSKKN